MKLSFGVGLVIVMAAYLVGFLLNDYNLTLKITGFVVIVSFVISGILNGAFISSDRYRANLLSETKEDRDNKMKIIKFLLLLSIPNVIISVVIMIFRN